MSDGEMIMVSSFSVEKHPF